MSRQTMAMIFLLSLAVLALASCRPDDEARARNVRAEDEYSALRSRMVDEQIVRRGIRDTLVLAAMRKVPRHEFVPDSYKKYAYGDEPLPIGEGQTISQPYIVALMTETLGLDRNSKVLEIGTGSGYQAAVLGEIAGEVCSIEIVESLSERAAGVLSRLGYKNVKLRCGDGYRGWPEEAPFDAIIVTAAPDHIPEPLVEQLKVGGRMSVPVGDLYQELLLVTKTDKGYLKKDVLPVRFVPMTGEAGTR